MRSLQCPIRRGQAVWPYGVSADDRLLEMDFEALVYEKTSPWQNIRIVRTRLSGNALFLDGDASQYLSHSVVIVRIAIFL